jgi:hypothetical protein
MPDPVFRGLRPSESRSLALAPSSVWFGSVVDLPVGAGNSVTSLTCDFGWCSRLTGCLCKPVGAARAVTLLLLTRSVLPRANREIT